MILRFAGVCMAVLLAPLSALYAAPQSYQAPLVSQSLLLDIAQSGSQLVAVGERGHIILSTDGNNWQQVDVPSTSTLTGVYFIDQQGWAVGHDATILHSNDGGQQWHIQNFAPSLQRPLLDVLFFDSQHGIAVGAYGTFLRTRDGGQTWLSELHEEFLSSDDQQYLNEIRLEDEAFYQQELGSILPHLNSVSLSGDTLYLAGEAGLLAFSEDFGAHWQRMDIEYSGSFFNIAKTSSGALVAAGLRGNLFVYDQLSSTWNAIVSGSNASLNGIISVDNTTTVVLGNNGAIVTLVGDTVTYRQVPDGESMINGLVFKQHIIAVSVGGIKHLQEGQ
ncbi:MAG: photosystem II stability/assembly factor-like uncharacterized protein [Paraglaciecola sp.]|jgi:photosystem II stability/assembly factor-like uncharacterized protein